MGWGEPSVIVGWRAIIASVWLVLCYLIASELEYGKGGANVNWKRDFTKQTLDATKPKSGIEV